MMQSASRKQRVLIVGAKFGEMYLNAFMQPPEGLELAGLLAQGSPRARALSQAFAIPLYTAPEQITEMPDIACIVVRSTVAGGAGTRLARYFLERGVHVIQEHPLHPDDIALLQGLAREKGCAYWINTFYTHARAGRTWIGDAGDLHRRLNRAAQTAQLTTSRQLLYSSLDMLLLALDVEAAAVSSDVVARFHDFDCLKLSWPGGEACLMLQRYIDPDDPDMHSLIMHRLLLGWPEGYLSLESSYGPVIWSSSLYVARHQDSDLSLYQRQDILREPPALTRCPSPATWRDGCEVSGPEGVSWLLQQLREHIAGAPVPRACAAGHQADLARLWQQILSAVGSAENRTLAPPEQEKLAMSGEGRRGETR